MANFTPQQIEEFLQEFFDVVGTRQYIGARYVPIFGRAGESTIEWDDGAPYEPLTVVTHDGDSFVSRRYVPSGIDIDDLAYWAPTYRFNAQIAQFQQIVNTYTNKTNDIEAALPISEFDATHTVKTYIDKAQDLSAFKAIIYSDSTFVESTNVPGEGYTGVLGTMIAQRTHMTIDNRGVGGTSLVQLIDILEAADPSQFVGYDYVFVAYGTNDWQAGMAIWRRGAENDVSTFEWRLNRVMDLLESLAPQCQVVFVTPAYGSRSFDIQQQRNYNYRAFTLEDYANVTLMTCRQRRIACIDLYHTMDVNEVNKANWMVRSTYDSSHEYYDIWVHYSRALKERIANLFFYAFPYNVPADPFDTGSPIQFTPSNISWTRPHSVYSTPVVPGLFFNSIGSHDTPHSQTVMSFYAAGDFTFSCQATEPSYIQFSDGTTVKRFSLLDTNAVNNIHVTGLYGTVGVYAVDHLLNETPDVQKKTVLQNVRISTGMTRWTPTPDCVMPSTPVRKITSPVLEPTSSDRSDACTYTYRDGCVFVDINYQKATQLIQGGVTNILTFVATPFADLSATINPAPIFMLGTVYDTAVEAKWLPHVFTITPAVDTNAMNITSFGDISQGAIMDLHFSFPMSAFSAVN